MIPFEFSVCVYGEGGVLVEVDATVGKLAEGSLLLDLGGLDGILWLKLSACVNFGMAEHRQKG